MGERVRFGILGAGVIGKVHANAIASLPDDAELVAVADPVTERAGQPASEHGTDAYDSSAELLARDDIDAVCVCTPSGMHAANAIAALDAGKHVVIEKPLDVSMGAIDRLIDVWRGTDRKVTVISQHRFDPAAQIVHDAAESGRFGRLTVGAAEVAWWRSQAYYDSGEWRGTLALDGGGALMNQSIHTIDLLQWVMGPAVEVTAYTGLLAHERIEVEDTAVAIVRFESGALGTIMGTTAAYPGLTARLTIHGDRGSAIVDGDELRYFHTATAGEEAAAYGASGGMNQAEEVLHRYLADHPPPAVATIHQGMSIVAHVAQLTDFVAAIREDWKPLIDLEEGRRPVALILAIYESARTGKPVGIPHGPNRYVEAT